MRKVDDSETRKTRQEKREKNGENSDPLTSLPVDRLNGDRLQRRRLCQHCSATELCHAVIDFLATMGYENGSDPSFLGVNTSGRRGPEDGPTLSFWALQTTSNNFQGAPGV